MISSQSDYEEIAEEFPFTSVFINGHSTNQLYTEVFLKINCL